MQITPELHKIGVYLTTLHMQLYYRQPSDHFISCNVLMHDGSCHTNALRLLYSGLLSSLKLYLPIYCIPLLLFKSKMLLTKPLETLGNLAKNTLFSALFRDVDITTSFYTAEEYMGWSSSSACSHTHDSWVCRWRCRVAV